MNKQRRKEIEEITAQMQDLRDRLEAVMDEEQDSYDNLPESFRNGERGEAMYDAIDNLSSALGSIDEALDYAQSAIE